MARLNGNSLDWVLRDCAEHAVVMIDKIEWGHRGRRGTTTTLPARTSYWNPKQSGTAYISPFFFFSKFRKMTVNEHELHKQNLFFRREVLASKSFLKI